MLEIALGILLAWMIYQVLAFIVPLIIILIMGRREIKRIDRGGI